ncbi:MAG: adenylosuccinate lyase [Candidatus Aenigmatarchaeota archaeon]
MEEDIPESTDPIAALSPVDGRYERYARELTDYLSEAGIQKKRTEVEIEYLKKLAGQEDFPLEISEEEAEELDNIYEDFTKEDAELIKQIETQGWEERNIKATKHDVKAVEYFIRGKADEKNLEKINPYVHMALTSEDVTNSAYALAIKEATEDVILPKIKDLGRDLAEATEEYKDLVMPGHTHGQKAVPTTLGKEFGVYLGRLGKAVSDLERSKERIEGKLGGATGTMAAHDLLSKIYDSDIDWMDFSEDFVESMDLEHVSPTTQIKPRDDIERLFQSIVRANNAIIDLNRDCWMYISRDYLREKTKEGEVGSSTMPQKVNPIDFENSEGNLSKANFDLEFLGNYLTKSRMQRDLSDSTVLRNIGPAFGHAAIGYEKTMKGLNKITANIEEMQRDVRESPEMLGEALQIALRAEEENDAYEWVKDEMRGESLELSDISNIVNGLEEKRDISEETIEILKEMEPSDYTGLAEESAEKALEENKEIFEYNL